MAIVVAIVRGLVLVLALVLVLVLRIFPCYMILYVINKTQYYNAEIMIFLPCYVLHMSSPTHQNYTVSHVLLSA
jgi:hypothetical protein